MTANGWLQFAIYSLVLLATTPPVGIYLARVFEGERTWLDPLLRPIERLLYKICGVNHEKEMNWRQYAYAMLGFSAATLVITYAIERLQAWLPWNPQHLAAVGTDLAWNTAASFTTNTNWQFYTPESTMSYLTEMAGLATHNFWSAAVGIVVAIALIRGIKRTTTATIGNFWVDTTRCLLYVLTPACVVYALLLVARACRKTFTLTPRPTRSSSPPKCRPSARGRWLRRKPSRCWAPTAAASSTPTAPIRTRTPRRSQTSSQILSIFIIPAGLTYTLGRMTGSPGHGWAVFGAMFLLFAAGFTVCYWAESHPYNAIHGAAQTGSATAPAGNMEGKEVRFGIADSTLFATITTDASCGAVNGMHDSYTPLGGMVPLSNIMLGEVVFGGVGAGMYGMLIFVVLAVFIAGLMVGRTPEYLGKKIESYDVKMAMLYALIFPLIILTFTAIFVLVAQRRGLSHQQPGPARVQRDPLRLYFRRGQQRFGLRGTGHELVVQRRDGLGHAHRPLPHDDSGAGAGRQPGHEEERSAFARNLPGEYLALYRAAGRRGADRRRAYLLPGAEPGADPGTPAAQGGPALSRGQILRRTINTLNAES